MKLLKTNIKDLYKINYKTHSDHRGDFHKIFAQELLKKNGINLNISDQFYTISNKDVLRGMHFQVPPHDHSKLVICLSGRILDVVIDIRKNSQSYGSIFSIELDSKCSEGLFIPSGFAHGFLSLSDNSGILYNTNSSHSPSHDKGIKWNSFGFKWPIKDPIISDRDDKHLRFDQFKSPF